MVLEIKRFVTGMHYVSLEDSMTRPFRDKGHRRVLVTAQDSTTFHAAILPHKQIGNIIFIGSKTLKKLGLAEGDTIDISLAEDHSEYQFSVPEAFNEVLEQDPEAKAIFQSLTPGNQRGLLYLVGQVKSLDKQIERALRIAEQLKSGHFSPRTILR